MFTDCACGRWTDEAYYDSEEEDLPKPNKLYQDDDETQDAGRGATAMQVRIVPSERQRISAKLTLTCKRNLDLLKILVTSFISEHQDSR
jgi:hypothetical protein